MAAPSDTVRDPAFAATEVEARAPLDAELAAGTRIRQYELIRELGRGGMGRVFLARDLKLGRRVAMKFLTDDAADFTARSLAEARATARCSHENIVVIHEADEHHGRPYIVLEYLEGTTLRRLMEHRRLSAARTLELMLPVVRALACAHEFAIVHRDLKPENVFVTLAGVVKVLDFGIAKLFARGDAATEPAAGDSGIAGTLPYMAPEQLWDRDLDARADLWAVGVMLYEMLAGHHPIVPLTRPRLLQSAAAVDEPLPSLAREVPNLPHGLVRAVDRCLGKHREQRFASARELAGELEALLPRRLGRPLGDDESPYPGLGAFQEADAERFFGRAAEVARLVALLRAQPVVGVVGPSGVGKSSFVRAGVIPALKASGEAWEVLVLRPGRSPLAGLASLVQPFTDSGSTGLDEKLSEHEALVARLTAEPGYLGALLRSRAAARSCQILLFVDQLEELYTLVPDQAERRAFGACLAGVADDAAAALRLVVSLRSDFLDRVAEERRLLDDLTRGLVFLQPLGADGLRAALTQPIEAIGYGFESPPMVDEMVGALAGAAGALPLLQFAAGKLWEGRDRARRVLTHDGYRAMGGLGGALAAHADAVLARLSPAEQRLARTVLPRLVTPERTRAIGDLEELGGLSPRAGDVAALIDHLAAARLLVVQAGGESEAATVELVHESLIDGWPTLGRWLDEGREDAAYLHQLATAARQWEQKGRAPGLLWRGEAADDAQLWRARYRGELSARELAFLRAVFAAATRSARLKRGLVAATIGVLMAMVAAGAVALVSIRRAERRAVDQADRAQRETERARDAERRAGEQLAATRAEQAAKNQARAEVEKGKGALADANQRLQQALGKAEEEARRAGAAAAQSQQLTETVQRANARLEKLLAEERAHRERLEKERKKISSDLR